MNPRRLFKRLRELGWAGFTESICGRLGFILSARSLILLKLDLARLPENLADEPCLRLVPPEEVRTREEYDDGWFSREAALERLEKGCLLFALHHAGEDACFGWSERGMLELRWLNLRLRLPGDVVYLAGLYTVPALRGRGLGYRIWTGIARYWKLRGAQHLLVAVDPENSASLKLHQKMGFRGYQTVWYKRYGFLRYYRAQNLCTGERRWWFAVFRSPKTILMAFWDS